MTFSSFRETCQPLFKLLQINILEIKLYLIANFMYLHYYGKRPETLNDYFVINGSIHYKNTAVDQLQKYKLILKEQITENFSLV